ncbi:MAG: hypothetical protein QOG67_9 [Verrucomicrobiota bacterium]|jgi:hypothetical protein
MLRVILTILCVLILDFLLWYVGWVGTVDVNMIQIARAYHAYAQNPTPESQDALADAQDAAGLVRLKYRAGFGVVIFFVTAGGFFLAGRQFERRRIRAGSNNTLHV